jgi:hypothetical protein
MSAFFFSMASKNLEPDLIVKGCARLWLAVMCETANKDAMNSVRVK